MVHAIVFQSSTFCFPNIRRHVILLFPSLGLSGGCGGCHSTNRFCNLISLSLRFTSLHVLNLPILLVFITLNVPSYLTKV
jgi:hypothetical protein